MNNGRMIGERVEDTSPRSLPNTHQLKGKYVELHCLEPSKQSGDLFAASHGSENKLSIWTYMPMSGPFETQQQMEEWLGKCRDHSEFIFFAVYDCLKNKYVGMTSFVSIVPAMQRLEVGFIWYSPDSQRTKINTESIYLMLCEAFDRLKYRRVEWKCDSLNLPSRNAALRLGFHFEGIFRKHMIVNGHNRDTAWFAMTETDWPQVKTVMTQWLYDNGEYFSLGEANRQSDTLID